MVEVIVVTNNKSVAVYRDGIIVAFASSMERSRERSFLSDVMHANGRKGYLQEIPGGSYPAFTLLDEMGLAPKLVPLPNLKRFPALYENIGQKKYS